MEGREGSLGDEHPGMFGSSRARKVTDKGGTLEAEETLNCRDRGRSQDRLGMDSPVPVRTEKEVLEGEHLQHLVDENMADDQKGAMRMLRYHAIRALRARDMQGHGDEDAQNVALFTPLRMAERGIGDIESKRRQKIREWHRGKSSM